MRYDFYKYNSSASSACTKLYEFELPAGSLIEGMLYECILGKNWKVVGVELVSTRTYLHDNSPKSNGTKHYYRVMLRAI